MSPQSINDIRDDIVRLTERVSNLLIAIKVSVTIVVPLLVGYLVYDHQQQEKISDRVSILEQMTHSINDHGTRHVVEKAAKHHETAGCHFK